MKYISEKIIADDDNIDVIRQMYPEGLHFVVGDTHGQKDTLKKLMSKIMFDSTKDHVYFVGDYNEGGSPDKLLKYMALYYQEDYEKPGFHMIRGNHERELCPLYSLENLPDIIVVRGAFLNFYIVHAGIVSLAYEAINEDMEKRPEKKTYAYRLDEYSTTEYDAPLRQLTWSRPGLYSQNSHLLKHRWPTTTDLRKNHACIIHGHTPYCYFANNLSNYGNINLFWEKQHIWFSEDLCSYDIDSNIKGTYIYGEMYRGITCVCLEVCDEIASKNQGMLTIEAIRETDNGVFSAAYIPEMSDNTEGNINSILNASPKMKTMKTITVNCSEKVMVSEYNDHLCAHENAGDVGNMAIGYRYSEDADGNVFIIKLYAPHERLYLPKGDIYCSEDCICESITNADTGEEVEQAELQGVRSVFLTYKKGELIPGGTCWYFHSVDRLYLHYLVKDDEGATKSGGSVGRTKIIGRGEDLYRKLDQYILETCELTFDDVAAELQISEEDLIDKLHHLTVDKWTSHEQREQAGKPILDAVDSVYRRKIESGEIIPGWKRYLMENGIKP